MRRCWTRRFNAGYNLIMSQSIPTVFDSGVFRPLEPVDLAEGTRAEVILVVSPSPSAANGVFTWPTDYFATTAGALAGEVFDRPPQGDLPTREVW
jgi:hypothetical protein